MNSSMNMKFFQWEIWKSGQMDTIWDTGTAYQKPGLSQQNRDSWNVCASEQHKEVWI